MRVIGLFGAAATSLTLLGCSARPPARVEVQDAAASASAPGQTQAAAYLTLRNDGGQDDALRSIKIVGVGMANVHDSEMTDGVMRMLPVDALAIPAGATVTMAPGGLHVMLMGLKSPMRSGDTLTATLRFRHTAPTRVTIPVQSPAVLEGSRGRH